MLMIVHSFHKDQIASLIVYPSFDRMAVGPVDSVREYILRSRFSHLPNLVSRKGNALSLSARLQPHDASSSRRRTGPP
jgi:hypothetical protein